MTKTKKSIFIILGLVIGVAGYLALQNYLVFASKPLGPALPVAPQTLPPLWTATPVTVTPVPTIYASKTPAPLCGGALAADHGCT